MLSSRNRKEYGQNTITKLKKQVGGVFWTKFEHFLTKILKTNLDSAGQTIFWRNAGGFLNLSFFRF